MIDDFKTSRREFLARSMALGTAHHLTWDNPVLIGTFFKS
jgi:hypothetical protein